MELKRDIYKDLLQWKQKNKGKVLELKGARQIGKTYMTLIYFLALLNFCKTT